MGKWIHQSAIDREDWDKLVLQSEEPSVFCLSFYLDSTAEDWYAYTDDDFSFAIPVAAVMKLGVPSVYPPFFHRAMAGIGATDKIDWNKFEKDLLKRFPRGTFHLNKDFLSKPKKTEFPFQKLNKEKFTLKTQAKRQLKKFENSELILTFDTDSNELSELIIQILGTKLELYNSKEGIHLKELIKKAKQNGCLKTVGILNNKKLTGGLVALDFNKTTLYLKGACEDFEMTHGAMYAAMNALIEDTFKKGNTFDFGGSRVEGVRFFNTRFSGEDDVYYQYTWENGPKWFKTIQFLRKWIKK